MAQHPRHELHRILHYARSHGSLTRHQINRWNRVGGSAPGGGANHAWHLRRRMSKRLAKALPNKKYRVYHATGTVQRYAPPRGPLGQTPSKVDDPMKRLAKKMVR